MSAATCPVQPGGFSLPQMAFARGMSQSDSPCSLWLLLAVVLPTWGQRHCCAFSLPNSFRINIKRTKNGGNSMKIMAFHHICHHLSIFLAENSSSRDSQSAPPHHQAPLSWRNSASVELVAGVACEHKIIPQNEMIGRKKWDEMAGSLDENFRFYHIYFQDFFRLSEDDLQQTQIWGS